MFFLTKTFYNPSQGSFESETVRYFNYMKLIILLSASIFVNIIIMHTYQPFHRSQRAITLRYLCHFEHFYLDIYRFRY